MHTIKKMKHNDNQQIIGHRNIKNGVHPLWVTSPGPGVKSGECTSLLLQDDDEYIVHSLSLQGYLQLEWHVSP